MFSVAEFLLIVAGVNNLAFAIFHLLFWRLFRWKDDLASLTSVNRAVMQILNLCLTFVFLIMAYVSIFHRGEMLTTGIGHTLLWSFALFWFLRMIEQIIFVGLRRRLSQALTLIFFTGSLLYLLPAMGIL